jgi:hypothetical protein
VGSKLAPLGSLPSARFTGFVQGSPRSVVCSDMRQRTAKLLGTSVRYVWQTKWQLEWSKWLMQDRFVVFKEWA